MNNVEKKALVDSLDRIKATLEGLLIPALQEEDFDRYQNHAKRLLELINLPIIADLPSGSNLIQVLKISSNEAKLETKYPPSVLIQNIRAYANQILMHHNMRVDF